MANWKGINSTLLIADQVSTTKALELSNKPSSPLLYLALALKKTIHHIILEHETLAHFHVLERERLIIKVNLLNGLEISSSCYFARRPENNFSLNIKP